MHASSESPYPMIKFTANLADPSLSTIDENRADELNKLIRQKSEPGESQDLSQAELYAQKMSICHGVPGLIHYVNLQIRSMDMQLEQGEIIDHQAFNTLCYLHLAKRIYQTDKRAPGLMSKLLPEENASAKEYWDKKNLEITRKLNKGEFIQREAERVGEEMFEPKKVSFASRSFRK
jgi:hypothetical protein